MPKSKDSPRDQRANLTIVSEGSELNLDGGHDEGHVGLMVRILDEDSGRDALEQFGPGFADIGLPIEEVIRLHEELGRHIAQWARLGIERYRGEEDAKS